jgi:two-component system, NtrC family, response regulator AtoC
MRPGTNKTSVWVVDDDDSTRGYLEDFLSSRGYQVEGVDSGEQVLRRLAASHAPALMLLDIRMPHLGGLDVLEQLDRSGRRIPSIVLSGVDQVSTVVKAMRYGAADYLVKPFDEAELETAIEKTLAEHAGDAIELGASPEIAFPSSNRRMLHIRSICDQVARTDVPILIMGESGAGKEVLAR